MIILVIIILILILVLILCINKFEKFKEEPTSTPTLSNDFKTFLNNFFTYLFQKCSTCPAKELQIVGICSKNSEFIKMYGKYMCKTPEEKTSCNIVQKNLSSENANIFLDGFKKFNLITVKTTKSNLYEPIRTKYYILNSYKTFSWDNIQNIDETDCKNYYKQNQDNFIYIYNLFTDSPINTIPNDSNFKQFILYIQYIFWYFRKVIVDSILSELLSEYQLDALSVGSIKITSDYDITLAGNSYYSMGILVGKFNSIFIKMFYYSSDIIFQTTIYASSFFNLILPDMKIYKKDIGHYDYDNMFSKNIKNCSLKTFKYVLCDNLTIISQHIWAYTKLLMSIENVNYDQTIYSYLLNKLNNVYMDNNSGLILDASKKLLNMYPSNPDYLEDVILKFSKIDPSKMTLSYFNNFISYVSYNSSDSYNTRGAMLDVVINQQMCSADSDNNKVPLNKDEYLDSFIENLSEVICYYHKNKYITRAKLALQNLKSGYNISDDLYNYCQAIMDDILNGEQQICNDSSTITNCSPFSIMDKALECVLTISVACFSTIDPLLVQNGINNFTLEF